jgi:hypothetical protein
MSDCHGSDSPSNSYTFMRSDSDVPVPPNDQQWLQQHEIDGVEVIDGDEHFYHLRQAHSDSDFFSSSASSFPSYAEDSFLEQPAFAGAPGIAPFAQEHAMTSSFSALNFGATTLQGKENPVVFPAPSAVPVCGGGVHMFGFAASPAALAAAQAAPCSSSSCRVVLAPSVKAQMFGSSTARVEVVSTQFSGGALAPHPQVLMIKRCIQPGKDKGEQRPLCNPFCRAPADTETSDEVSRNCANGARRNAVYTLETRKDCTGFTWTVKIRFSCKLNNEEVEFGTRAHKNKEEQHMKNVEVLLVVQNVGTGKVDNLKFTGRLFNSNKKKPNPGFLILQFLGIQNDDLPHVNFAARHVRQFIDEAIWNEAQRARAPAMSPTYQLLFLGTIQYSHAHISVDDESMSFLQKACKQSPRLRQLCFERSKGNSRCCKLKLFEDRSKKDPSVTVEIYPSQFKVTERYEDQDVTGQLHHKHLPYIEALHDIIAQLCQRKRQASCEPSSSPCASHAAPAAVGAALHAPTEEENWHLFDDESEESDDESEDWDAEGIERCDGNYATICSKRFLGS